MSRYHSYLNTATTILQQYSGEEPFASFLKKFFSLQKKYGSRDRKVVSHLCYCFFRLGKLNGKMTLEERILLGLFLCSNAPDAILEELKPAWSQQIELPLTEKLLFVSDSLVAAAVFPWKDELSAGIDHEKFCQSFFIQPDLFLRLRPGSEETVRKKLKAAGLAFENISETCLALANASKIDSLVELNREAVVQDYSSQRVGEFLHLVRLPILRESDKVWDCCAGSGGKSIMLHDLYPGIDLSVSDIRESIIINLKKRFNEASIEKYKSMVVDVTASDLRPDSYRDPASDFDFIIADVPCTGSGTWSRTPEQLYYFEKNKINEYASLQKKIVSDVMSQLKPRGYFLYITCSVFKKENEDVVGFINQDAGLELIKMEVLKGYDKKADTMFTALFQKK